MKIPMQFMKFPLHHLKVQWVYAEETKLWPFKLTVMPLFKELTEEQKCRAIHFNCKKWMAVFEEKLLIFQD